jgi:hypothetical protein
MRPAFNDHETKRADVPTPFACDERRPRRRPGETASGESPRFFPGAARCGAPWQAECDGLLTAGPPGD